MYTPGAFYMKSAVINKKVIKNHKPVITLACIQPFRSEQRPTSTSARAKIYVSNKVYL